MTAQESAEQYVARAGELRTLAQKTKLAHVRQELLSLAANYDLLARHAEQRSK